MPVAAAASDASVRPRRSCRRTPPTSRPSDASSAISVRAVSPIQPFETAITSRKKMPTSTAIAPTQASTRPPSSSSRSTVDPSAPPEGARGASCGRIAPLSRATSFGWEVAGGRCGGGGGRRDGGRAPRGGRGRAGRGGGGHPELPLQERHALLQHIHAPFGDHVPRSLRLTDGRQATRRIDRRSTRLATVTADGRARLHPPGRRRAPPAAAGPRRRPVRALQLRRALDGPDRARGGHLEGAAVPLLPRASRPISRPRWRRRRAS